MKSIIVSVAVAAGLMVAGGAMADEGEAIFKANCMACHGTGVGPKPAEIAAAYNGDKAALKTFLTVKGTAAKVAKFASKAATMQSQIDTVVKGKVVTPGKTDAVVDYLIAAK
ncbi:MAG: c-type cytochrome [Gallionella sp.]|nr:c-type cytochrome [Gallionella sp.]